MDGRPMLAQTGCERTSVGVKALELRQQRWMNVEHAPAPARDEPRRQQPHEAGEANEINPVRLELMVERAFERLALLVEGGVIDDRNRHALLARAREALRVGAIRYDERDLGRVVLGLRGFDPRPHVRASARNENGDALSSHAPYQDRSRCPRNSA